MIQYGELIFFRDCVLIVHILQNYSTVASTVVLYVLPLKQALARAFAVFLTWSSDRTPVRRIVLPFESLCEQRSMRMYFNRRLCLPGNAARSETG